MVKRNFRNDGNQNDWLSARRGVCIDREEAIRCECNFLPQRWEYRVVEVSIHGTRGREVAHSSEEETWQQNLVKNSEVHSFMTLTARVGSNLIVQHGPKYIMLQIIDRDSSV
jgi:1,4-alpha-glucan branching enzyme